MVIRVGADPHYNGTAAEATAWGQAQAARTLSDIANGGGINYPVVWADIELPGIKPAPDNGWNSVYTSPCSGIVKQYHIPYAQFFGGQTYNSKYALMWQWSGGGGISNGVGDFDQIDSSRLP